MTPEERDLIADLFARLRAADTGPKDAEADAAIRGAVAQNPAAPYLLVQTVLVQEHALKGAQAHILELEQQLADAQRAHAQPSGGSFLGNLLGRSAPPPAPPQPVAPAAPSGPWGRRADPAFAQPQPAYQPQPGYAPTYAAPGYGGGGFLRSALTTAAGVAGGALLFQGVERMLGYGASPFGGFAGNAGYAPAVERETVINNYYDDNGGPQSADAVDRDDGQNYDNAQQADYDNSDNSDSFDNSDNSDSFDSGGGDFSNT